MLSLLVLSSAKNVSLFPSATRTEKISPFEGSIGAKLISFEISDHHELSVPYYK